MARRRSATHAPRTRPRWFRGLLRGFLALGVLGILALGGFAFYVMVVLPPSLPSVAALENYEPIQGTKVFDDNDELLTEIHAERRIFVPLAQVPPTLRAAVLAIEDTRFYSHFGVDPVGIARAVYQNFRRGRIVEGGSTITQQLAKVLFLTPDKSLSRKLREAVLALELERRYTKDRILELYLNNIYFGHGAFGVEAAARTYFAKGVSELTVAEAALLAGLPKAPTTYSPFERADAAKRRRAIVLARMVDTGVVKAAEVPGLAGTVLGVVSPDRRRVSGQYYLEYVQQVLEQEYGADIVFKGGLQVYTALSPTMQLQAERAVREGLRALEARRLKEADKSGSAVAVERPEGALLALEPQTGYIRAMVGGYDFTKSEFNRAVHARRQPGSAFKAFVYIAALESGLTPATIVDDSPVEYPTGPGGRIWKPDNHDRKFRGAMTIQRAVEESVNVVAIKVQERVGVRRTVDVARRLGVESPLQPNLSLALGTSDVTLLEITSAFGALANGGALVKPNAIRYVLDGHGRLLLENIPEPRQALAPETAFVMTHMLRGTVERGTGTAARAIGRPAAAKTGSTNDYSNAWFIGYTPDLVTGVWVGYDRPRSLGRDETGARAAVPIWTTFMSSALAGRPVKSFSIPSRVTLVPVDLLANGECTRPVTMAFTIGSEPTGICGPATAGPPPALPPTPAVGPASVPAGGLPEPAAARVDDTRAAPPLPAGPAPAEARPVVPAGPPPAAGPASAVAPASAAGPPPAVGATPDLPPQGP
jgi:1A family penicillin-binding protein